MLKFTVNSINDAINMVVHDALTQLHTSEEDSIYAPALVGPPGIGKSQAVLQALKPYYEQVIVYSLGVVDSDLEFIGLPDVVKKSHNDIEKDFSTKWITPDRLNFDKNKTTLIIFDDFHLIGEKQQSIIMQVLTNERTIHTHKLGENTSIVFIGNRMEDNAGSIDFYKPVISRLHIIEFDPPTPQLAKDWINYTKGYFWRLKNGTVLGIHPSIIRMVESNNSTIYTFDPDEEFGAYSCPRTLEYASRVLYSYEGKIDSRLKDKKFLQKNFEKILAGLLGSQVAVELKAFYDSYIDLDIETLFQLKSPEELKKYIKEKISDKDLLLAAFSIVREIMTKLVQLSYPVLEKIKDLIFDEVSFNSKIDIEHELRTIPYKIVSKIKGPVGVSSPLEIIKAMDPTSGKTFSKSLLVELIKCNPLTIRHLYKPEITIMEFYKQFQIARKIISEKITNIDDAKEVLDNLSQVFHMVHLLEIVLSEFPDKNSLLASLIVSHLDISLDMILNKIFGVGNLSIEFKKYKRSAFRGTYFYAFYVALTSQFKLNYSSMK